MSRVKFLIPFAAILLSLFVSCEKHEGSRDAEVALTISIPSSIGTKAISDGSQVNIVHYVAFGPNGKAVLNGTAAISSDSPAVINAVLVKYVEYNFVFWAHKGGDDGVHPAYDLTTFNTDGKVVVSYEGSANDEDRDAFYNHAAVMIDETAASLNKHIYLYRPFAQINFLATDYDVVEDADIHKSLVSTVEIADIPNVLNGQDGTVEVSGEVSTALEFKAVPVEYFNAADNTKYGWYSMNYILAAEGRNDNMEVLGKFMHGQSQNSIDVPVGSVPYQRNYRTNIIGDFLTEQAELTVEISPNFVDADGDGMPDDIIKNI